MSLGRLVCGASDHAGNGKAVLDHLCTSIDRFATKARHYLLTEFNEEAQSFGAFCARVVLENSCAGILGRLDTFRLLYLREIQAQADYEYGKPAKSGFKWTGDVLALDKPNVDMWSIDHDIPKISRALFSQYSEHLYWGPAFTSALDEIAKTGNPGGAFDELLRMDSSNFIGRMKGQCTSLYSTLSKGVHWEFFTSSVVMDEDTVKASIRDSLTLMSDLALVSHFVPTAYHSLPVAERLRSYLTFRESLR